MTDVSKAAVEGLKHLRKPIDLKSMTKADARVAIAKDVLAALDAKKITPRHRHLRHPQYEKSS